MKCHSDRGNFCSSSLRRKRDRERRGNGDEVGFIVVFIGSEEWEFGVLEAR